MESRLSSVRPLILPLLSNRCIMTASEHSNEIAKRMLTLAPRVRFQPSILSKLRGKPSITYFPPSQPRFSMACCKSRNTISTDTNLPFLKQSSINSPISDPGLFRSSRNKSPALRCWKPKDGEMRLHCVPFPAPGPPSMKITDGANNFFTCSHTTSHVCSASILCKEPALLNMSMTGKDSWRKVVKRLRIDSRLSSVRPLVLPRSRSLASIVASPQSKNNAKRTLALVPTTLFHPSKLSALLGKPSTRYLPPSQPHCSMALTINFIVISTGTSFPSLM
mmetsp:Transcript_20852/g.52175  ORF Transcript_20852/g.52175 Transcript_20852/m.52175 type:complete len:278 (-) Transcript_20852:1635-2468(-)